MKFALATVVVAACLGMAQPAFADSAAPSAANIKRAADAFDRGRDALRAEEYIEAAEHFEAADAHAQSAPALRFAITARREAGQLARAATLATLVLTRHPDDEDLVELSNSVIEEAKASLYKVDVSCDEPCELVLDDKIIHGQRNEERVIFVEPGAHRLRASWTGNRTRSERLEARAGESGYVNFFVPELAAKDDEEDLGAKTVEVDQAERSGWSPVVFWTGLGVTVAGGVVTTLLGVHTQNNPGQAAVRACDPPDSSCAAYKEGRKNQLMTNVALAATSAAGVFTIVTGLFLTDWESDDSERDSGNRASQKQVARRGLTLKPWFEVGETTAIGATGTF